MVWLVGAVVTAAAYILVAAIICAAANASASGRLGP